MPKLKGHIISGVYPSNWPEIALRIKEKAGKRCERCHHPAEGPWKMGDRAKAILQGRAGYELTQSAGLGRMPCDELCTHSKTGKQRMLTVDHLDGNKSNCADWNLAALWQSCHLHIQGRVRMEQFYAFEHSGWMKPHIAGMEKARA